MADEPPFGRAVATTDMAAFYEAPCTPGDDVPMSGAQSTAAIGVERNAPAAELIEHDPEQLACPEHRELPSSEDGEDGYLLFSVHFCRCIWWGWSLVALPHDHVAKAPEEAEHEHDQDSDCQDDHVAASSAA